jgi:hypothetical protein
MFSSTAYYTLIGSLPTLPPHFEDAERVPISRIQLNDRLRMLEPRDARVIDEMAEFLIWERQPLERTDQDVIDHAEQFLETVDNRFAIELIHYVLQVRTIVAGLRLRRRGLGPPPAKLPVAQHIARHWEHPDFRLGNEFRWIASLDSVLNSETPFRFEKITLDIIWQHAKRLSEQYFFTFEAVVLYLIRWEVVYRWTRRDAKTGRKKFQELVDEAMGEYAMMFQS